MAVCRLPTRIMLMFLIVSVNALTAQAQSPSASLDRLITVEFRKNAVHLPAGVTKAGPEQLTVASTALANCLSSIQVESIAKAFPDFALADTLGVARSGELVRLTDWSEYYEIKLRPGADRGAAIRSLNSLQDVLHAEGNGGVTFWGTPVYPNDPHFVDGSQWGLWHPGAQSGLLDIDAPEAWGITQGHPAHKIAIVDQGFDNSHPDFANRVTGSSSTDISLCSECAAHGFLVAGVAGARGNNGQGIAGIDWNSGLLNCFMPCGPTNTQIINAIQLAIQDQAVHVLNASWTLTAGCQGCDINAVRKKFVDVYKMNLVAVAAMGNTNGNDALYPAAINQGVIAVGASDENDNRAGYSTIGDHIDVIAPGSNILSTTPTTPSGYGLCTGTSFAAPVVSGIASLLYAKDPTLYNDDVQHIIQLSADDKLAAGWDGFTGWGRVNTRALRLTDAPNTFLRGTATGSHVTLVNRRSVYLFLPGFAENQIYWVNQYAIDANITFPMDTFHSKPIVWGRGVGSTGYSDENPIWGMGWCDTVPGTVSQSGATLRTYAYEVQTGEFNFTPIDTVPDVNLADPSSVTFNWSALEVKRPDLTQSFYVPQRGTVGSPIEGAAATSFFHACPNNDGGTSIPNNARIKIVVKDPAGQGIAGIQPGDVFVLLNGGTPPQSFIGDGADSVIANGTYNDTPLCPDVRALIADAPTDAGGVTYITFAGPTPGSPGVATRDPARKWGHFDTELPVYVLGVRLQGRLTSTSANGSYVLQIKNYDFTYIGLGTTPNWGEIVTSSESAYMNNNNGAIPSPGNPLAWWADFNNSGAVDSADQSQFWQHFGHGCESPP
jgi:subtilisin family serine protease